MIYKRFYLAVIGVVCSFMVLSSCKNALNNDPEMLPQTRFTPPVVAPLNLSKPVKLDIDALKPIPAKLAVQPFDIQKLPTHTYDSSVFKPYLKPVKEINFNFSHLREKDFDINKLPSKPLKLQTRILPPPITAKVILPHLKNSKAAVYECGEGLPGSFNNITKDHDGFLWIATTEGIYRYDGENYTLYVPSDGRQVFGILADSVGRIWIRYQEEARILDPKKGTLTTLTLSYTYADISFDEYNRAWLGSLGFGLRIISPDLRTEKIIAEPQGLSSSRVTKCQIDRKGNVWVAMIGNGLDIIDLKRNKLKHMGRAQGLEIDTVTSILFDHAGRTWLGSYPNGLLATINPGLGSIQYISELVDPNKPIYEMFEDHAKRVWIGTQDKGVAVLDPSRKMIARYTKSSGLAANLIYSMVEDNKNQVWLSTGAGLSRIGNSGLIKGRIDFDEAVFAEDSTGKIWMGSYDLHILDRQRKVYRKIDGSTTLGGYPVQTIIATKSNILIGTDGGLVIVDNKRKTMGSLKRQERLAGSNVTCLIQDHDNRIWMGGSYGVDVYDPLNQTLKHIGRQEGLPDSSTISDIRQDAIGRIWMANRLGYIFIIDQKAKTIQHLRIGKMRSLAVMFGLDDDDRVWCGRNSGVSVIDLKNKLMTTFTTAQGLTDNVVTSLLLYQRQMYVSTTHGVSIITIPVGPGRKWKIKTFGAESGIRQNLTENYSVDLITKDGLYWRYGSGVSVLDFSKKDTAQCRPMIAGIKIMDKPQYWQAYNPAFYGSAAKYKANNYSALGQWIKVSGPYNLPYGLRLNYDQNFLQFQFSSFDLTRMDSSRYRYKLLGADTGWSEKTNDHYSRNYFNLKPGEYTFELTALNFDGSYSKPALFSFIISPPWWETWWAWVFYLLLLAIVVYTFAYYRSKSLVKEKRVLEYKVQIRTEEVLQQKQEIEAQRDNLERAMNDLNNTQAQLVLREKMASLGELTAGIAHEIQNPLNFVNNFSEVNKELLIELKEEIAAKNYEEAGAIADDVIQNEEKINHHGKRADAIVKGMLEHSRVGSGVKEPTDINKLADEYLRLSYHGLRAKDKSFNASLVTNLNENLPLVNVIPQDLGRVLLNLFNNAFYAVNQKAKTADLNYQQEVTITTYTEGGKVIIKVKDNGIGIPDAIKDKIMQPFFTTKPTGEGTGLGLSLTYDMVVKGHGGKIEVNSTVGEGSEFVIQLPIA